ncbi:signal peptidase II [Porticoccus sp.]|uniref:signal peptidase II n=1 Tax=Porticoccus sp. TaxID=2024853 RepID=UPI003F69B876
MQSHAGWYLLSGLVILVDQITKYWASASLVYGRAVELLPILNLTLLHNPGAAFSFLSEAGGWQRWFFTVVALAVSIFIGLWMARLGRGKTLLGIALALVLGGAIGNLLDRVFLGYVVDFIDIHYLNYHWPAFNVADSAITVGAILLVIESFYSHDSSAGGQTDG